jgi:hypothetical protein
MTSPTTTEPEGCRYREHSGDSFCNKLCDPGGTLCPFHQLLSQQEGEESKPVRQMIHKTPRGYQE